MGTNMPRWIIEAGELPLGFAQVREDAALDLRVAEYLRDGVRIFMVGSGGCTVAALAACGVISNLHIVDSNPTQIALCRLKLRLLQTCEPEERLALLGHAPMPASARQTRIKEELYALGISPDVFGPTELMGEVGPDHLGCYEHLFTALRRELHGHEKELADLLGLRDPSEQVRRVNATTSLGRALDQAFERVMALPNLVKLFGEAATANRRQPFPAHFASRTRHVLKALPAAGNPYLSQIFLGRFTDGVVYPWLSSMPPVRMPHITWETTTVNEALRKKADSFDFVHLSNTLDWLPPQDARRTLELAWAALRSDGVILLRQLNSTLDIPALESRFDWLDDFSRELLDTDRSFFYRAIYLGRK